MARAAALALTVIAFLLVEAGWAAAATNDAVPVTTVSTNWAGFVVAGPGSEFVRTPAFTRVSGSWTAPAATCTSGSMTYSAFWVGLGGASDTSRALEQIGSAADCAADGTARYYLWYELVPAAPHTLKLRVDPADRLTATVAVTGKKVTLVIRNLTRATKFSKVLKMSAPAPDRSSAEWIAEAPSSCSRGICTTLPLTNFGTVSFTNASAIANGHKGVISDSAWGTAAVQLQPDATDSPPDPGSGSIESSASAAPSGLSPDGTSFTVSWVAPDSGTPQP